MVLRPTSPGRLLIGVGLVVASGCAEPTVDIGVRDAVMSGVGSEVDAAVYLTITNDGEVADELVDVGVDGASMVHVHRSEIDESGATTMSVSGPLRVEPGERVELVAGGLHLMVIDPPALAEGDEVDVTLRFARAGTIQTEARVVPAAEVPIAGGGG